MRLVFLKNFTVKDMGVTMDQGIVKKENLL